MNHQYYTKILSKDTRNLDLGFCLAKIFLILFVWFLRKICK